MDTVSGSEPFSTAVIYNSAAGARLLDERYGALLDAWPVPHERLRVPSRAGETFVVASGPPDAPPVLLLHGSGTNAAMWQGDVPTWAGRFRVYAVDVIGEPGRSAPARPPLGSDAYAGWLDDVLAGLGLDRASIVGASLGGWLAVDYATRRPERVDRLVLLCPGGIGRQKWAVLIPVLLLMPFGRWGKRAAMRLYLGRPPRGLPASGVRRFLDHMLLVQRHFRPRRERLPVFDDGTLRRLTMPVLVIAGERDAALDSRDTRRRLARTVPHATVRLLPGVGHFPAGQAQPILEFLLQNPRDVRDCPRRHP
ncbi:MAG TPA: alpha/beta fold hydrolase [Actinophytocola sp.]|uniref:alpha/beta fold hydrolase n=1 Tax=Actinophytocola sp. TaxID=1872138 RepID=UPI002DBAAFC5|nr:alpha/beta fold hydrolase [Actinophytocola sp.]HEU5472365.1 alpha/beta fold hydrolase [Actinophytocola sp.]